MSINQELKQVAALSSGDFRYIDVEDKSGIAVNPSTTGDSNAREKAPLLDDRKQLKRYSSCSHEPEQVPEVKAPFLIVMSMGIAGLWFSCCCSCDISNSTDNGRDYLSKAGVWSPTEPQGPQTTGAEQRRETHGQHQEDHHGCHQGCGKWNSAYQVVCIIILLAFTAFFVSDILLFFKYTQLEEKYLLDTASFICLNFQTFSAIIYTTFVRLKLCCWRFNPDFHAMPFDMDTCMRRTTLVQAFHSTSGKCYLESRCSLAIEILVFFLFPLLNAILQIVLGFSVFFIGCESNWQMATLVIKSVLYIYYGCFWYVVYVQRIYLNCILNNALDTIRKMAEQTDCEGTREGARRLIDRIYSVFNVFRYFTGRLMAFTFLTVTFHSLCCGIFTHCKLSMVTSRDKYILLVMLWIQNIMFFVLPIYAIGGINLESLWKNFRHVLIKCKVQGQIEFWNEAWSYVTQIDTLASFPLKWTGLFSIFGAILKFIFARRDSISLEYWSYLSKSCTDSMENNFTCLV